MAPRGRPAPAELPRVFERKVVGSKRGFFEDPVMQGIKALPRSKHLEHKTLAASQRQTIEG